MKKLFLPGICIISCCQFLYAQQNTKLQSSEKGMHILFVDYNFSDAASLAKASPKINLSTISNNNEVVYDNNNTPEALSAFSNTGNYETRESYEKLTAKFVYNKESGALSEGFNNIFETGVESANKNFTTDKNTHTLSFMSNPNANSQPDTYKGIYWYTGNSDNGGVHTNSGVLNYWFYLLSKGGNGTNDKAVKYTVAALGIAKAQAIAYRTINNYLLPAAEYKDARIFSIRSAEDLFGKESDEVLQTMHAWDAVGVDSNTINQGAASAYESPKEDEVAATNTFTITKINLNQTFNQLNIELSDNKAAFMNIAVYDKDKKLIFCNDIKTVQGNNRLQINLPSLADGKYVLKVDNVHSESFSVKH